MGNLYIAYNRRSTRIKALLDLIPRPLGDHNLVLTTPERSHVFISLKSGTLSIDESSLVRGDMWIKTNGLTMEQLAEWLASQLKTYIENVQSRNTSPSDKSHTQHDIERSLYILNADQTFARGKRFCLVPVNASFSIGDLKHGDNPRYVPENKLIEEQEDWCRNQQNYEYGGFQEFMEFNRDTLKEELIRIPVNNTIMSYDSYAGPFSLIYKGYKILPSPTTEHHAPIRYILLNEYGELCSPVVDQPIEIYKYFLKTDISKDVLIAIMLDVLNIPRNIYPVSNGSIKDLLIGLYTRGYKEPLMEYRIVINAVYENLAMTYELTIDDGVFILTNKLTNWESDFSKFLHAFMIHSTLLSNTIYLDIQDMFSLKAAILTYFDIQDIYVNKKEVRGFVHL